jgi:hypothetical protein
LQKKPLKSRFTAKIPPFRPDFNHLFFSAENGNFFWKIYKTGLQNHFSASIVTNR